MRSFLNIFATETSNVAKVIKDTAQTQINGLQQTYQYQGDLAYFEIDNYLTDEQIKAQLASKFDSETYDALKLLHCRLIQGKNILPFYPDLVLCLHKSPHESKRFAYLILSQIQHLQGDSQDALMPINMLHKETQTKEPLRRADALKTITDMSVDEIYPWLFGLCKTACSDQNPYVKQTALLGILKIVDLTSFDRNEYMEELLIIVKAGLQDRNQEVITQAIFVASELFEKNMVLDLLHCKINTLIESLSTIEKHYSLICTLIAQYATRFLQSDAKMLDQIIKSASKAFKVALNGDQNLTLVNLICQITVIKSKSDAIAVRDLVSKIKDPLKSVLSKTHFERSYALETLSNLIEFAQKDKDAIDQIQKCFTQRLYFKSNEPEYLQLQKLRLMSKLFQLGRAEPLLTEICNATRSINKTTRLSAVKHLTQLTLLIEPSLNEATLTVNTLTNLLKHKDDQLVNESVISLQLIINSQEQSDQIEGKTKTKKQVVLQCAKRLQSTTNPNAKAMMIHLLNQQIHNFPTLSQETLRRLAKGFNQESDELVKCQILTLGSKVYQISKDNDAIIQIQKYLLKVASLDKSLIVRQKARALQYVFESELSYSVLLEAKPALIQNDVQIDQQKPQTFLDTSTIEVASSDQIQKALDERNAQAQQPQPEQLFQNQSARNEVAQSMSSDQFKGMLDSLAASAQQNYNRSHFSKKDGNELKQEYEDFFKVVETNQENVVEENKNEEKKEFVSMDDF